MKTISKRSDITPSTGSEFLNTDSFHALPLVPRGRSTAMAARQDFAFCLSSFLSFKNLDKNGECIASCLGGWMDERMNGWTIHRWMARPDTMRKMRLFRPTHRPLRARCYWRYDTE